MQLSFFQEEKMFHIQRIFPGITHITDAMGVSFTLIEGGERAVLFDTGYGTENVRSLVEELTEKPISIILSHGHHDHILGARWFSRTMMCRDDMEEFRMRTGRNQREKVAKQADDRGVTLPDDYLDALVPEPETIIFPDKIKGFECLEEDLGGLGINIIHVPGHTPGSIVIHVPYHRLLLTGDNWNPCTWMWFPTSLSAKTWKNNMLTLTDALEQSGQERIEAVLCSHQPAVRKGTELKRFLAYMTDKRMKEAPAVNTDTPINAHEITKEPEGWVLRFDLDKI